MNVLVVDNYDSFTWNLVQMIGALGATPVVHRNDRISRDDVQKLAPSRIVFSPGPGDPTDPKRTGVCRAILEDPELVREVPILGVCLGHQLIVAHHGGRIVRAREPMHGKTSLVHHEGEGVLAGLPRPFEAMRYHSLVAHPDTIPSSLVVTAWCKDGTVMAVRHRQHPIHGVQFHPESIGTAHGRSLVATFLGTPPSTPLSTTAPGVFA